MSSNIQDAISGTHRLCLAHGRIHSRLLSHPHVHSNISSIVLIKKLLGVPISGVHQAHCPEYIPPRRPLTRTHMYERRHTKTPMGTLTRTETTLRCLARVRTRPGAPACYFSGSQSSTLQSSAPGGGAQTPSTSSPLRGAPTLEWEKRARCPRERRKLGVRRLDRRAEGDWS